MERIYYTLFHFGLQAFRKDLSVQGKLSPVALGQIIGRRNDVGLVVYDNDLSVLVKNAVRNGLRFLCS